MSNPWRTTAVTGAWTLLGHPKRGLEASGIDLFRRGDVDGSVKAGTAAGKTSSIIIGVVVSLVLVALAGFGVFYFFKQRRQRAGDVESAEPEKKRNWFAVDGKDEKRGVLDWWRQSSYTIPDRVEPPTSARPERMSLARLRNALTRKGALKGHARNPSSESTSSTKSGSGLLSKITNKVTSPTQTIDLPLQTVPQPKPRYPSVLERGYRVPLYPIQSPPEDRSPPRSLTTPQPPPPPRPAPSLPPIPQSPAPITVAERSVRKKVIVPPRALKISNGRPLIPYAERKTGTPRSPAHRQRRPGFMNQFKHPFLPLKDSDTAFPTISGPMPSADTAVTNPKLGYGNSAYAMSIRSSNSVLRSAPMAPGGPRSNMRASRRIPVPVYQTQPSRPLLPATPLHLREDVRVLPPGLSPAGPRFSPAPI